MNIGRRGRRLAVDDELQLLRLLAVAHVVDPEVVDEVLALRREASLAREGFAPSAFLPDDLGYAGNSVLSGNLEDRLRADEGHRVFLEAGAVPEGEALRRSEVHVDAELLKRAPVQNRIGRAEAHQVEALLVELHLAGVDLEVILIEADLDL